METMILSKKRLKAIESHKINHLELRSDIESGMFSENGAEVKGEKICESPETWAIDVGRDDVWSYLYESELEYENDLAVITTMTGGDLSKSAIKSTGSNKMPNDFDSWHETHYEVCIAIGAIANKNFPHGIVGRTIEENATGGMYELAKTLTDEFEAMNDGREWDGEYFDEINEFLEEKLK